MLNAGKANGTEVPPHLMPRVRRQRVRYRWELLLIPILLAVPAFLGGRLLLGVETVQTAESPLEMGRDGFPHDAFDELLQAYVIDGRVNYAELARHSVELERYAATLAESGPTTDPRRFPDRAHRLAYYLNAYNAFVLLAVTRNWPIDTVLALRGPIEPTAGFGFFWGLRFELDGDTVSLTHLEDDFIRAFGDARIHAAICCAAAGCPSLPSTAFSPETLDRQLDVVARRFVGQPRHVRIDDEAGAIVLSPIFDWYAEDFREHAQRIGAGDGVVDWIRHYASPDLAADLSRASQASYAVDYGDYDWRINALE